jgi:hypothetical protein
MRDYTGAFPDREMFETWVVTTSQDNPIRHVQAFVNPDNPRTPDCPELGGKLYQGNYFDTFEKAKASVIRNAATSLKWAQDRLAAAHALENPLASITKDGPS